jgi:N-acyl-phosphatidylethanolamine-hydrolysing phospholipase D
MGPARLERPGVAFDDLPPIDAVVLSHDHYDHLDRPTVKRLVRRFGGAVQWLAPLGHRDWLTGLGARRVAELDWSQHADVDHAAGAKVRIQALPARHWTRRSFHGTNRRLWCSWVLRGDGGPAVYFTGDSGYCAAFQEIGREHGPFDAALIPIGAYEPRWFMEPAHMNPEEAVRTYLDLGGAGTFMGIHWGTFQLTDEPVDEPPRRARAAWEGRGLPESDLWIPAFGETRVIIGG